METIRIPLRQSSSGGVVGGEEVGGAQRVELRFVNSEAEQEDDSGEARRASDITALVLPYRHGYRRAGVFLCVCAVIVFVIAFLLAYAVFGGWDHCSQVGVQEEEQRRVLDKPAAEGGGVMYLGELRMMMRKLLQDEDIYNTVRGCCSFCQSSSDQVRVRPDQIHRQMMKMILLFLFCVLSVSADSQHEDIRINGCSDFGGESMYGLDGEEIWYADFVKKEGVYPQPDFIDPVRFEEGVYEQAENNQQICKTNLGIRRKGNKDMKPNLDPPSGPMIYPSDEVEIKQPNTLICLVTGFYPAPVNVSWTKNGEKVAQGVTINVPYPKKDGTFTQISRLDFIPVSGDLYSCTVHHPALTSPLTRIWDVEVKQPGVGPAVFCGLGLTIGLLGVAAGTFFLIKGNECS